tara:strand:+ start:200 stop:439 length:240 start_codon:yes stop_codon:yes gene_type:complete
MDFEFEFIYGSETVYVGGSVGYSGTPGDYDTPSDYEAVYSPENLEIIVSGEYESETVNWHRLDRDFKDEIVKQIDKWVY